MQLASSTPDRHVVVIPAVQADFRVAAANLKIASSRLDVVSGAAHNYLSSLSHGVGTDEYLATFRRKLEDGNLQTAVTQAMRAVTTLAESSESGAGSFADNLQLDVLTPLDLLVADVPSVPEWNKQSVEDVYRRTVAVERISDTWTAALLAQQQ